MPGRASEPPRRDLVERRAVPAEGTLIDPDPRIRGSDR